MTEIVTSQRQVYRHPKTVCYVADKLEDAAFVEVPYLYATQLRRTVAPEMDVCYLVYNYGNWLREGNEAAGVLHYDMQDLVGKFVRVVSIDTVYADAFALDPDTEETDQSIYWTGIIELDQRQADGSTPDPGNLPSGAQFMQAYGLLRLLEKTRVDTSIVDVDGTDISQMTVKHGIQFNNDPGGSFITRGNRSTNRVPDPDGSYIFSWETRELSEWRAFTAVEYLLAHHSPKNSDGEPANVWRFADDVNEDYLNWYDITEKTDGRTVKSLLDSLISRQRGVSYWAEFDTTREDPEDPETAANEILIHVFTFNSTDVTLPDGTILKANPNTRSLDFEHSFDIDQAIVGNVTLQRYHEVVARGAKRTTTFTAPLEARGTWLPSSIIGPSWTEALEDEYKAGASDRLGYGSLTTEEQQAINSVYRASDRLHEVFRRFRLNTEKAHANRWNGKIAHPHDLTDLREFWLKGDQTQEIFSAEVDSEIDYDGREVVPLLRILRSLPLVEGKDYSGTKLEDDIGFTGNPSYIPLFVYVRTLEGDGDTPELSEGEIPHRYEYVDKLHWNTSVTTGGRKWACRLAVLDTEPGIEIVANIPHFIAGPQAGNPSAGYAETDPAQLSSLNNGLSYEDMRVTMCVELNEHIERSVTLEEPPDGAPKNTLIIPVPDARHDYVLPGTTVEILDGLPIATDSGGLAKDDTERLDAIATSAAEWYSKQRQTLNLRWRQIRATFELGWLITDVGGQYQISDINTPITAITYDFGGEHAPGQNSIGATMIETAFTEMDFLK